MNANFTKQGVIAVITVRSSDEALRVAESLLEGGLRAMEVTLRTPAALDSIRTIAETFPDVHLGAGTILTREQANAARDAGAQFGLSPGLNESVVEEAAKIGLPFIPGVMTPSEIERGLTLGCKLQKFFPAESMGGAATLDAISKPYTHTGVQFVPLGGVSLANADTYLRLLSVAAIGGSWIADRKLIDAEAWSQVTQNAALVLDLVLSPKASCSDT